MSWNRHNVVLQAIVVHPAPPWGGVQVCYYDICPCHPLEQEYQGKLQTDLNHTEAGPALAEGSGSNLHSFNSPGVPENAYCWDPAPREPSTISMGMAGKIPIE